jgi:tetratricopeptide (TPR) repeat protein
MFFDLEKEALTSSGLKDGSEVAAYTDKLDRLTGIFLKISGTASAGEEIAERLFRWLWQDRPGRYEKNGAFRLHQVIDGQLDRRKKSVGNCLGLTLLYNCMLRRVGTTAGALYLERAFEIGPHVLTLLEVKDTSIDIENILPEGFGYRGHLDRPDRIRWGDRELVADIYHSMGNEWFAAGVYFEALACYEKALGLNPEYEKAHLNRAILLEKINIENNK